MKRILGAKSGSRCDEAAVNSARGGGDRVRPISDGRGEFDPPSQADSSTARVRSLPILNRQASFLSEQLGGRRS